mgnify:CR=1 FL=1
MHFNDGMSFDLKGPLRIERRSDGYYVVGEGILCPVDGVEDGEALIEQIKNNKLKKSG